MLNVRQDLVNVLAAQAIKDIGEETMAGWAWALGLMVCPEGCMLVGDV